MAGYAVANTAEEHGQVFTWSEFVPQFVSSTFEKLAVGVPLK
jgi:hypothetical protein